MKKYFDKNIFMVKFRIPYLKYDNVLISIVMLCIIVLSQESFSANFAQCMDSGAQPSITEEEFIPFLSLADVEAAKHQAILEFTQEKWEAHLKSIRDSQELWQRQISIGFVVVAAVHLCKKIFWPI